MRRAVLAVLLLSACGARTGLESPPSDAEPPPRFDAGMFTTFPCRWTLGVSTVVARGDGWTELTGAVHPTLDQAAVLATQRGEERGAIVSIAASGGVLAALAPETGARGALFTGIDGYLRQRGDGCEVIGLDAAFMPLDAAGWDGAACQLTQSEVGRLESVSELGEVLSVRGLVTGPDVRAVARLREPAPTAFAFHDDATDTTLVALLDGSRLVLERHLASGVVERHEPSSSASRLSAAADSLRGGMMVHYRDRDRGWRLEHLDWEAGRPPEDHFDLSGLPEPSGPIATNETEILIPLADGRIAYVPFALVTLMVRWVEPVEGAPVDIMHIVLRPDGSAGGVLYQSADALRFQPLVCNR